MVFLTVWRTSGLPNGTSSNSRTCYVDINMYSAHLSVEDYRGVSMGRAGGARGRMHSRRVRVLCERHCNGVRVLCERRCNGVREARPLVHHPVEQVGRLPLAARRLQQLRPLPPSVPAVRKEDASYVPNLIFNQLM